MISAEDQLYVKTPGEWRKWLRANHAKRDAVWLVFYKKETGRPTVDYDAAVEEALCWGWIDSILKKLDERRYARKFTPRKPGSRWSPSNKRRVERLIAEKRMTRVGLAKVEAAKENGQWDLPDRPSVHTFEMTPELRRALARNRAAREFFERLAPSHRNRYVAWIAVAKRPETRARRVKETIAQLARGQKPGMV